jgi:hypothetical protein
MKITNIKTDIDKDMGSISIETGKLTKDIQMHGALVRLGWIPPDEGAEIMKILNDLVYLRQNAHNPSIANQGQAMDGFSMLYNYNNIVDKIISSENVIIDRYVIRGK